MRNEVRKQIALAISFFGAAVLVSFPPALRAQNPGGSLLVTVQDSTGARVAGASVSLTQEKFAISRTGKADAQGEKRFESLQPGSYTVTVNVTGFAEKTAAVVVAVSSQPVLVVTLQPQSVRESVEVRDRGPSLASRPAAPSRPSSRHPTLTKCRFPRAASPTFLISLLLPRRSNLQTPRRPASPRFLLAEAPG